MLERICRRLRLFGGKSRWAGHDQISISCEFLVENDDEPPRTTALNSRGLDTLGIGQVQLAGTGESDGGAMAVVWASQTAAGGRGRAGVVIEGTRECKGARERSKI